MHIKFLAHGTGDPRRAATYLTGLTDHDGKRRALVRVLRGNPAMVAEVAVSLRFVHRYTSGVISWAREDDPTPDEIEAVLDDYERLAFAGLDPDRYAWSAIQHVGDEGDTHIHVLVARVDLATGKSMNIAAPGWERVFDPLRDHWNHLKGWARPDDPARARMLQPGRRRLASAAAVRRRTAVECEASQLGVNAHDIADWLDFEPDTKQAITDWLLALVHAGEVNSRGDLLEALARVGDVTRASNDYVSVRIKGAKKPVKLKGRLYRADLDGAFIRAEAAQPRDLVLARADPDPQAAEAALRRLEHVRRGREAYNLKMYPRPQPRPAPALDEQSPTMTAPTVHAEPQSAPKVFHERDPDHPVRDIEAVVAAAGVRIGRAFRATGQRIEQAVQAATESLTRCIRACRTAGSSIDAADHACRTAERAVVKAQRAILDAQQAGSAAERACDAVERAIAQQPGRSVRVGSPPR